MSKRTLRNYYSSSSGSGSTPHTNESTTQPKKPREEFSHSNLIADPAKRKPIDSYAPEIRDQVKRAYALSGPTQPHEFSFPRKCMGGEWRSFQKTWFDEFDWLEYSESKDAAYCLYCYLFFNSAKSEKFGSTVFAHQGYVNWKNAKDTFHKHNVCKTHAEARLKCDDFMNQRTSVGRKLVEVSTEEEKRYEIRLTSSLDVARFLISQGEPFRGDDESSTSLNKGTFREMVDWYKDKVDIVKDAYDKGSKNCQMLSPDIQKDLANACAEEVTAVIMDEIRGRKFSVLIDESRDVSIKEQMAVILRLVLHNCNFVDVFYDNYFYNYTNT
jgi:hypothetical protein